MLRSIKQTFTLKSPIPFLTIEEVSFKSPGIWATSSEFGTYRLCEQGRFRRACASAQSPQNLRCSLIQAESRGTFRQKPRSLAPLNGWACAVKICHDGMVEDTNLLDAAHLLNFHGSSVTDCYSLNSINNKWAMSWENLFIPYANNKGTDQSAHLLILIIAFAVYNTYTC